MKQNSKALTIGLVFLITGSTVIFLEQVTDWGVSKLIARLYCGARYMQTTGQPGDGMCGFNMDMVLGMASFLSVVFGLILIVIGIIKKFVKRKKES